MSPVIPRLTQVGFNLHQAISSLLRTNQQCKAGVKAGFDAVINQHASVLQYQAFQSASPGSILRLGAFNGAQGRTLHNTSVSGLGNVQASQQGGFNEQVQQSRSQTLGAHRYPELQAGFYGHPSPRAKRNVTLKQDADFLAGQKLGIQAVQNRGADARQGASAFFGHNQNFNSNVEARFKAGAHSHVNARQGASVEASQGVEASLWAGVHGNVNGQQSASVAAGHSVQAQFGGLEGQQLGIVAGQHVGTDADYLAGQRAGLTAGIEAGLRGSVSVGQGASTLYGENQTFNQGVRARVQVGFENHVTLQQSLNGTGQHLQIDAGAKVSAGAQANTKVNQKLSKDYLYMYILLPSAFFSLDQYILLMFVKYTLLHVCFIELQLLIDFNLTYVHKLYTLSCTNLFISRSCTVLFFCCGVLTDKKNKLLYDKTT